LLKNKRIVH